MFSKQDIAILKGMFSDAKRENRDELHSTVQASENRILQNLAEMLHVSVLTQIDNLENEITSIKAVIKMA
jgi:hypothetical protein